jgi:3-oxoacyl-[acyl-carrier protein] reductase
VSSVALNKVFVPVMFPGSSIIYISSLLGKIGVPNHATYIVTKHAMVGLMKATCQDLADKDIRSYCICPGLVNTERLKTTMTKEEIAYILNNKVIGKRMIETAEIAEIILFCAISPALNGTVIEVTLGRK